MKVTDLMPILLLLDGFDEPYITVSGQPHFGPVHTGLIGESGDEHDEVQQDLAVNDIYRDGSYIGFGGWINLGYIAKTKPSYAVLADINPLQAIYWQAHFNLMAICETGTAFEKQLIIMRKLLEDYRDKNQIGVSGYGVIDEAGQDRGGRQGPLFRDTIFDSPLCKQYGMNEAGYKTIRSMVLSNRIGLAVMDVKDSTGMQALHDAVKGKANKPISLVHVSNIMTFIEDSEVRAGVNCDFAHTPCDQEAVNRAKRNILILAHGRDRMQPGCIVWTKAANYDYSYVKYNEVLNPALLPSRSAFAPEQYCSLLFHPRDLAPAG